jgi:hypothetical protein
MLLCDTGVLLAAGNVKDHHHAACLALMRAAKGPLLVPSPVLGAERARLYADLGGVGDFRKGALSAVFRKCGPPAHRRDRHAVAELCRRHQGHRTSPPRPASARPGWEQGGRRTDAPSTPPAASSRRPPGRVTRKPCAPLVEHARLRLALQHKIRAIRPRETVWSRPISNWLRPQPSRYQHRLSTRSGNDGK